VSGTSLLIAVNVVIGLLCLTLIVLLVVVKFARDAYESAREARADAYRLALITIAAGADEDGTAVARLTTAPRSSWPAIRDAVVELLAKVRGDTSTVLVDLLEQRGEFERARTALRSRSAVYRARGAYLLGLARRREDAELLIPLLTDRNGDVRLATARALGAIGEPEAAGPLFAALCLVGGRPGVPTTLAAQALLDLGTGAYPAVVEALGSEDATVRAVATLVAAEGALTAAAPRLRELLAGDPGLEVRICAAQALGAVGEPGDVFELARRTAPDQPTTLRRAAVQALGELGHPDATGVLSGLLSDPDVRLAQHSGDALVHLGPIGIKALMQAVGGQGQAARVAAGSLTVARLRKVPLPAGAPLPEGQENRP
jgi:HEAT repeat protein